MNDVLKVPGLDLLTHPHHWRHIQLQRARFRQAEPQTHHQTLYQASRNSEISTSLTRTAGPINVALECPSIETSRRPPGGLMIQ